MSEQQHVPIEDLAAYAAGDLDAAAAVTVEAHVVLCAECRSDVEAVKAASAALAEVPAVTMPEAVAARLDAALAAERAPARGPVADVLPMAPRRRRPSWSGAAAAAAGVALLGALAIPFVTGGGSRDGGSTAAGGGSADRAVGTRRLASGLEYSRGNVAATLDRALAGATTQFSDNAGGSEATGATPPGAPTPLSAAAPGRASTTSVAPLRTDPARLAACLTEIVRDLPVAARTPLVVDFARFMGREAVVLVFPSFTNANAERPGRVDVYVVGGGCGVDPGGDILDYQRIARPNV